MRISQITAPVGEGDDADDARQIGQLLLALDRPNSPSAASLRRRSSSSAINAPAPAGSICSMTIWYFEARIGGQPTGSGDLKPLLPA